jgi:hypothetical protein
MKISCCVNGINKQNIKNTTRMLQHKVIICILHKILLDNKIKNDAMSRACSMRTGDKKSVHSFGRKTQGKEIIWK